MYKTRCICGKNEFQFKRLSASDFPNGFEDECCKQKRESEEKAASEAPEIASAPLAEQPKRRPGRPKRTEA